MVDQRPYRMFGTSKTDPTERKLGWQLAENSTQAWNLFNAMISINPYTDEQDDMYTVTRAVLYTWDEMVREIGGEEIFRLSPGDITGDIPF